MGETKRCPNCRRVLPRSAFNFRDREHKRIQSYCRECSNGAWRDWYAVERNGVHHRRLVSKRRKARRERNKALVRRLKDVPCTDCGKRFPPEVMDFDHIEDKTGLISRMINSVSTERLVEEIAKCEVVCANCHRIRTARRMREGISNRP